MERKKSRKVIECHENILESLFILPSIAERKKGRTLFVKFLWKYIMAKKKESGVLSYGVLNFWLFCPMAKKNMAFSHMAKLKSGV